MNFIKFEAIIFVALVSWAMVSLFYSYVVRPVLRDRLRFKLFAMRDDLRRMGIDGEIAPSSFNYMYLETMLCRLVDQCFWYTWGNFFEFLVKHHGLPTPADLVRFDEKAPEPLKKIRNQAIVVMIRIMMTNSPIITLAIMCLGRMAELGKQASVFFQEPIEEDSSKCKRTLVTA